MLLYLNSWRADKIWVHVPQCPGSDATITNSGRSSGIGSIRELAWLGVCCCVIHMFIIVGSKTLYFVSWHGDPSAGLLHEKVLYLPLTAIRHCFNLFVMFLQSTTLQLYALSTRWSNTLLPIVYAVCCLWLV